MHSLFKPIVAVLCLVFALCFAAPNAHADSTTTGTINFTVLSGGPTPIGFFEFDNNSNAFLVFDVFWDGAGFDFTPDVCVFCDPRFATLASLGQSGRWSADATGFGGGGLFGIFGFGSTIGFELGVSDPTATASGTYEVIITSVPTPEPSSVALTLAGIGLVFAMRKRSSGLQQLT
jgi:hypothetical protein